MSGLDRSSLLPMYNALTIVHHSFLELRSTMPRSYRRFLWFLVTLTLSLLVLLIGQAFATVYLSTLPHGNIDGLTYVWTWIATCNILNAASNWVLQTKVRSRALVFVFRVRGLQLKPDVADRLADNCF